jgi:hypothetical protein
LVHGESQARQEAAVAQVWATKGRKGLIYIEYLVRTTRVSFLKFASKVLICPTPPNEGPKLTKARGKADQSNRFGNNEAS